MTKNCKFETPCGMCEIFERPCKDVCGTPKNDRFKPQINPQQQFYDTNRNVKPLPILDVNGKHKL